jgi:septum formation protein
MMSHVIDTPSLILASASPRRRYLLERAGLRFRVEPSGIDEGAVPLSEPDTYVAAQARAKALDVARHHPADWVIAADTVVVVDGTILGKPVSQSDAYRTLRRLSGKVHHVYTGTVICCLEADHLFPQTVRTAVQFKTLSDEEIAWYIDTGEPFDKAGAYAIQGIGTFLVKSINGSFTNVVGLPVCEVLEYLIKMGIAHLRRSGAPDPPK